jgi:ABC-2 type transport system ATP-binding protein
VTEQVLQALVAHVAAEEATVLLSSHQISEVEQIADRVAIIDRGRVAVAGALDDLREQYRRVQLVFDGEAPQATFRTQGIVRMRREGRVLTVLTSASADSLIDEARALNPTALDVNAVTLRDIFLETVAPEN